MKKFIFLAVLFISSSSFGQALKQKSLAELEQDLRKISASIETTQRKLKTINDATFLPDLYMVLAELYVDKARYMYTIKRIRNTDVPIDEIDFANEKRPKQFAIETYQKLIDKFPNFKQRDKAMFFMAHEYRELGQLEEMVKVYQKLTTQSPNSPFWSESQLILGNYTFEDKKDYDYSLQLYGKILNVKDTPFKALARYKMGWVYINQGKWKEALLSFEKVLTEDGKLPLEELPEIYKKTDVRRDALIALVWPYSEIAPATLMQMGEWRVDPVKYIKRLSNNIVSYQKALAKLGRRLTVKQRYLASTRVYYELVKVTQDLDTRMDAIDDLYINMKNTQKRWPLEGFVELITETLNRVKHNPDLSRFECPPDMIKAKIAKKKPKKKKKDTKDEFKEEEKTEEAVKSEKDLDTADIGACAANKSQAEALLNKTLFNYEVYARDGATRLQERAKETNAFEDYTLAIQAYRSYLWAYPDGKYSYLMHQNLAESYFKIKKWVLAGKQYEIIAGMVGNDAKKKKDYLDSALESYTKALKDPDNLSRLQLVEARDGLRDVGQIYVDNFPKDPAVPETMFNIGRSYYDERDFRNSEKYLTDYLAKFPRSKDSQLAVDLILDAYNQKEDFAGLTIAAGKLLKIRGLNPESYASIKEISRQADYRKLQTNTTDLTSSKYAEDLLKFAQKYKGSNLGDQALYEAFTSLKSKKDPRAYVPGEELLIKHANSKYAKSVVFEMGKMAVLTADFRRAASYFEIFSGKYPKDPEARQLLQQAATMRETMGDLPQASKDFTKLGDATAVARVDYLSNNWNRLRSTARGAGGLKGMYWEGLALYRTGNGKAADPLLRQLAGSRGGSFEEKSMAAHALYLISMSAMKDYKHIQLVAGKEAQAVQAKTKMLDRLQKQMNQVIALGNGRWTIAALYGLGQANREFANFIKAAPMPAGLNAQQQQQYRAAIEQQAKQYDDVAGNFFKQCVNNSEKFEVFTNFTKGCQSSGNIQVDEESETKVLAQAAQNPPETTYKIRQKLYDRPRSVEILTELAQAYTEGADYPMSILILDRILEIEKNHSPSIALKGMNYLFMNDLEAAQVAFNTALKLNPDNTTALWGLAGLYNNFNFKSRLGPTLQKAKRAGSPKPPLHPWVRAIRF